MIEVDGGEAIAEGQNMEVGGRDIGTGIQNGEGNGRDVYDDLSQRGRVRRPNFRYNSSLYEL